LLVDDEDSVRKLARRMLEARGIDVVDAADGQQGIERFREIGSKVSAVLLDLTMPSMNGDEVYRAMRLIRPDVRVILMSGYSESDVMAQFADQPVAGFLQKPFRTNQLIELLRGIIEPGSFKTNAG
jgi:CheY-like chemotaxis protein